MLVASKTPIARITQQHVVPRRPPLLVRVVPALIRRARLWAARVRHPRATLGRGCDVRARFCLRLASGATAWFGERCILDNDLTVECFGSLRVGADTIFGHHCTIGVRDRVEIGEHCMLAEMVSIRDHDHVFDDPTRPYVEQGMHTAPVFIGRNVWIGAKATIIAGVRIGDNAVIGANAVVTRDIPANSVAVGIPAKVIRRLALGATHA